MPEWIGFLGFSLPLWIIAGFGFLLGAVFGSYLATILWRWPRGLSANTGRSHCDSCDRALSWYELIPIAGYVLARGRCKVCRVRFSFEHTMIETLCAFAGAYFFVTGWWWLAPMVWLLALLAIFDLRYLRLPDPLVAVLALLAIMVPSPEPLTLIERLAGGAIAYGVFWSIASVYRILRKRDGLGRGDVKLFGALGLWVGPFGLPELLLLACGLGFADLAFRGARGISLKGIKLPFGAYLAFSALFFMAWSSLFGTPYTPAWPV